MSCLRCKTLLASHKLARRLLTNGCLKEIVIPANEVMDRDGYTLLDQFSQASSRLGRPCTGIYQFKDASKLYLRPLPAAEADRRLPPPSIVFHTDSVDRIQELALTAATATMLRLPRTMFRHRRIIVQRRQRLVTTELARDKS
jgi:hypothetical protein